MIENLRVGGAAAQTLDARVVGQGVAIHSEQRAPRRVLCLPALRSDVPAAEVHVTVLDLEHRQVAFAVESDVAGVLRRLRVLRIGSDSIEGALHIGRELAFHLAVVQVILRSVDAACDTPSGTEAAAERTASAGRKQDLGSGRWTG